MALINQLTLPAIIMAPWFGAAFLLFIPEYENTLRKRFALFAIILNMVLLARNIFLLHKTQLVTLNLIAFRPAFISGDFQLRFDWIACIGLASALLVCFLLISSRLGDTHRDSQFFAKTLFLLGLANACFLFNHTGFFFLLQLALTQAFVFFHLLGAEPLRGSSALSTAVFFTLVDLLAFFVWSFQADLIILLGPFYFALILSLPALTRLIIPFASPWARSFFAASSLDASILVVSFSVMLGATSLTRSDPTNLTLATFAIIAAFFSAVLSLSEESLPQFLIRLASIMTSLVLYILTGAVSRMRLQSLLILGSFTLLFTVVMLIQRSLSESEDGPGQLHLFLMWFLSLGLILVGALELIPIESPPWVAIFAITAFSCAKRVLSPMTPQRRVVHFFSARLSGVILFNAWLCFGLTLLVLVGVHLLIHKGGAVL